MEIVELLLGMLIITSLALCAVYIGWLLASIIKDWWEND